MTEARLRELLGASIAIGPGKADLLQAIADSGSISAGGGARPSALGREALSRYRAMETKAWESLTLAMAAFRLPLKHRVGGA